MLYIIIYEQEHNKKVRSSLKRVALATEIFNPVLISSKSYARYITDKEQLKA